MHGETRLSPHRVVRQSSLVDLIRLAETRQQRVPPLLILSVLVQALEALDRLEHQDLEIPVITPQNLRLVGVDPATLLDDPSRDPKLCLDFHSLLPLTDCSDDARIFASCQEAAPEVLRGRSNSRSAVYSLGCIASRLYAVAAPVRRRRFSRVERFIARLHHPRYKRRWSLKEARSKARALAMDHFAADYRRRRIPLLENELEEAQAQGEERRVAALLAELRDLGARGPHLGLARIWLEERRLNRERTRFERSRHDRATMSRQEDEVPAKRYPFPFKASRTSVSPTNASPANVSPNNALQKRRPSTQIWLTVAPAALAMVLSGLIAIVLLWNL